MILIKKKYFSNILIFILTLFLVAFPKGGIKYFGIPITWGYSFLGLVSLFFLFRKSYLIRRENLYILIILSFFQVYSLISIFINGFSSIGFTISFFISFFCIPFIFLFILSEYLEDLDLIFFFKILKKCILFVAIYGIFLFFYKIITKSFLEIPLLTTNYHEKGLLETTKFLDRGNLFKLISTYNNGNLFGISILMVLPLYNYLEKSFFKKSLVILSLILTISRTVWVGLFISEALFFIFIKKNKNLSTLNFALGLLLLTFLIYTVILFLDYPVSWLFDTNLGTRMKIDYFKFSLFSKGIFTPIEEMVYFSIASLFGILGLIFFMSGFMSPVFIFIVKKIKTNISTIDKTILLGLITYLSIAFSDGAILFIPVLCFYWFLASLLLTNKNKKKIKSFF